MSCTSCPALQAYNDITTLIKKMTNYQENVLKMIYNPDYRISAFSYETQFQQREWDTSMEKLLNLIFQANSLQTTINQVVFWCVTQQNHDSRCLYEFSHNYLFAAVEENFKDFRHSFPGSLLKAQQEDAKVRALKIEKKNDDVTKAINCQLEKLRQEESSLRRRESALTEKAENQKFTFLKEQDIIEQDKQVQLQFHNVLHQLGCDSRVCCDDPQLPVDSDIGGEQLPSDDNAHSISSEEVTVSSEEVIVSSEEVTVETEETNFSAEDTNMSLVLRIAGMDCSVVPLIGDSTKYEPTLLSVNQRLLPSETNSLSYVDIEFEDLLGGDVEHHGNLMPSFTNGALELLGGSGSGGRPPTGGDLEEAEEATSSTHYQGQPHRNSFVCSICEEKFKNGETKAEPTQFSTKWRLHDHQKKHSPLKEPCMELLKNNRMCSVIFSTSKHKVGHLKRVHNSATCRICKEIVLCSEMAAHLKTVHKLMRCFCQKNVFNKIVDHNHKCIV